jgi:thiamine biosynthesis lipoprotein
MQPSAVTRFEVMGTHAEVHVTGGDPTIAAQARSRLAALETRWSRFRSGSDISELNRCAGHPVPVAAETLLLLDRSIQGARATEGRFDPTVGAALVSHGSDRTFVEVAAHARTLVPVPVIDASWPLIEIDHERSTAVLPAGTLFDPGGIGKGLAADLVVEELGPRAAGILVNIGGDVRMEGTPPHDGGWVVSVDDPFDRSRELGRLALPGGAVATSSSLQRRWTTALGPAHHIIDPRTGRPADSGVVAVTVVAADAWWAEVHATSLFLGGDAAIDTAGGTIEAVVVHADGTTVRTPAFEAVLR